MAEAGVSEKGYDDFEEEWFKENRCRDCDHFHSHCFEEAIFTCMEYGIDAETRREIDEAWRDQVVACG